MKCPDKEAFLTKFGAVYEHSPWVAERAFEAAMKDRLDTMTLDADALAARFESVFLEASTERQLGVLRAHPALACGRAEHNVLTVDSRKEQAGAGLDQCTEQEFMLFREMNAIYFGKYDIPFIIAVKGLSRQDVLATFRERLNNSTDSEFQTALRQVCRIARFRIGEILGD